MNFGMIAILLLAVLIFTITVIALMFYVRHWASRQSQQIPLAITEGRYVKRYIPPSLRPQYDKKMAAINHKSLMGPRWIARVMNLIIIGSFLVIVGGALAINRYKLMAPIDLTANEINNLRPVEASWSIESEYGLPSMSSQLEMLRKRGAALVISNDDMNQVINGKRIALMAENYWENFFARWKVPYRVCDWSGLSACMESRIGIILPGQWQLRQIEQSLNDGSSLILYGPPSSVLTQHKTLKWEGLSFEPFINQSEPRYLALRGDQVLTLGLDAGLILIADHAFKGYRVFSDLPQAVGINTDKSMGDIMDTRLYAKRVGKGRLVWMDYAPDQNDEPAEINVRNLEAVNATVFRYLLGQTYSSWATWPEGKHFAGTISEDSEDKFPYAENVVEMVNKHGFPITWFMLSNEAQLHRGLAQRMSDDGEIACHGDNHSDFPLGNLFTQTERIARCIKVVSTITGHTPRGFRPPEEKYNEDTISAVASNNMGYYLADDDMDRMVPEMVRENGGARELVSLPRMGSDDFLMWYTLKLDGEESIRLADDELTWISAVGGYLPFSFHTQYMGTKDHLDVVEHYGLRFQQPDCYFATTGQIADWWRVRMDLIEGKAVTDADMIKYRPVLLKVDEQGQLIREQPKAVTATKATDNTKGLSLVKRTEEIFSHE